METLQAEASLQGIQVNHKLLPKWMYRRKRAEIARTGSSFYNKVLKNAGLFDYDLLELWPLVDAMLVCAVWASVAGECVFQVSELSGPPPSLFTTVNFARFASSRPVSSCLLWSTIMASSQAERMAKDDSSFLSFISFLDVQKLLQPSRAPLLAWIKARTRSLAVSWPRRHSNVGSRRLPSQFSRNSKKVPPSLPQGEKQKPLHQVHLLKPCHSTFEPGISWLVVCRSRFRRAAKLTPHMHRPVPAGGDPEVDRPQK